MTVYAMAAGVWVSGAVWLIFHYFVETTDGFGFSAPHPLEKWWLILHSLFAVGAIWVFGVLWPNHIKKGWTLAARRATGGSMFIMIVWLMGSGVALYYIGSDSWRSWTSLSHWIIGLSALGVFIVHLLTRKRRTQAIKMFGSSR